MVRRMHIVMSCVVMEVGGTEGVPETGRAKPFTITADILVFRQEFYYIFWIMTPMGSPNELQTKEKYKSGVSMTSKESFLSLV